MAINEILIINAGSSSIKVSIFDQSLQMVKDFSIASFEDLANTCLPHQFCAIGHRFVHGGAKYTQSIVIDKEALNELSSLSSLAPLHNQLCLSGIYWCEKYFGKKTSQVAVFDTAFHQRMPKVAKSYAIPEHFHIQRFGFHGISNAYIWEEYEKKIKAKGRIIVFHLGSGCSATAIKDGLSLDTSMGFTPSEGLVMSTRAGDIDSGVIEYLSLHETKTILEISQILNEESGLKGISGISSMAELIDHGSEKAMFAIELFCYRAKKYLGAYVSVLGGLDAVIFTGGIGENIPLIRRRICEDAEWCGIAINEENESVVNPKLGEIYSIGKNIYVIKTNENLSIAKEVLAVCKP